MIKDPIKQNLVFKKLVIFYVITMALLCCILIYFKVPTPSKKDVKITNSNKIIYGKLTKADAG